MGINIRMIRFKTVLSLGLVLTLVIACLPCKDPIIIDCGKIPENILAYIPYQNGQTYKFRHSGGLVIEFASTRQSHEEWIRCERCCDYEYKFEVNTATLTPDYPLFSFTFDLSNMDSVNFSFSAGVGHYWFQIPTNKNQPGYNDCADSMVIGEKLYKDVFKIKSNHGSYYDRDTIFADSLYYNYSHGLIQVRMSNGEKYSIYE